MGIAPNLCVGVLSTIGRWLTILAYRHVNALAVMPFLHIRPAQARTPGCLASGAAGHMDITGAGVIAASRFCTAYRARVCALEQICALERNRVGQRGPWRERRHAALAASVTAA
jgi:hypothetical protein